MLNRGPKKKHPLYTTWEGMRARCRSLHWYRDKGVIVCPRWDDFWAFVDDMGPRPGPGYTLDRIDNDGNYEPENCRWATQSQQRRNRRNNVWITVDGETRIARDWEAITGVPHRTIAERIRAGWVPEVAATRRVMSREGYAFRRRVIFRLFDRGMPWECIARVFGMRPGAIRDIYYRHYKGARCQS